MHKIGKNVIALFLAGVMALVPAGESLAAGGGQVSDNGLYTIVEESGLETGTEDIDSGVEIGTEEGSGSETGTAEDDASEKETDIGDGSETGTEEGNGSEIGTEEGDGSETGTEEGNGSEIGTEEGDGSEIGIEEGDGSEIGTEEDGSDTEAEEGTELDSEAEEDEALEEDAEEEEEKISDADEETVEAELPGLKYDTLTSEQRKDKEELAAHLEEITQGEEGKDYVAGEIVFLADTEEEAQTVAEAYGGTLKSFDTGVGVVTLPKTVSVSRALTLAATSKEVVLPPAWPNHIYHLFSEDTADEDGISEEDAAEEEIYMNDDTYTEAVQSFNDPFLTVNSPYYQYQHAMVGSVYAWNAGYTGSGVTIAILDSGVYADHTDLNVIGSANHTDESDASDGNGHGTHVAGLAAAKTNSVGGAGIAPGASIYNIKVADSSGSVDVAWAMAGVNDAINKGVDIINMSLGGAWYNNAYAQVIKNAYNAGIAVFAAAGNDGSKVKCYPACYPGAYCIASVKQDKSRSYFSNYGSWVKFNAPGTSLYSTYKDGKYVVMSGTSQATPIVSGTAAVILSADSSIAAKSGKARVDALIKKMNAGKVSGIVSLPKALGIPVITAAPKAPVFETKAQTVQGTTLSVTLKPVVATDVIYYSIDGKNPTYKNGILSANASRYTSAITIGGKAKVTVKAIAVNACGKVSKVATATYKFQPLVTNITITGQKVLIKGKTTTLKAAVIPDYAASKTVTWKVVPEGKGVTIDSKGKVKAKATAEEGTYTITAESKDTAKVTKTFEITVTSSAKVKKIEFKDAEGKAKTKDTVTIGSASSTYNELTTLLKVSNTDGTEGTIADVDFSSSNTNVATVNSSGSVTVKGAGKAVITATANDGSGKKATFTLTVKKKITSIVVNGSSQLAIGKSTKLTATVNSDATQKAVTWSISPEGQGVTVTKGQVKATKTATAGSYTVVAKANDGDLQGSKVIQVSDNAITKIQLSQTKGKIFRTAGVFGFDTSMTITATVTAKTASNSDAVSTAVEFTSNNPGIATVSQNGLTATITAKGSATGTAKITCKALDGSGKSAVCTVTVANPASHIAITPPAGNGGCVAKGKKIKLKLAIEEELGAVSSKSVIWQCGAEGDTGTATIDKNGNVKGTDVGTVTITAKLNDGSGLSTTYVVEVTYSFKKLNLSGFWESAYIITSFKEGYSYTVDVLYDNKTCYEHYMEHEEEWEDKHICDDVSIEVGNPDIISAGWSSYYGTIYIHAKKAGRTKITVKAMDGSGVKKTYNVMVR